MPKAEKSHTTHILESVPDPTEDALALFRRIADQSADSLLLADGPPDPDWKLLDECAKAIAEARILREFREDIRANLHLNDISRMRQLTFLQRQSRRSIRAVAAIPAATSAGVFSKAVLIRATIVSSELLARSLANDMIHCAGFRQALWPSHPE